MSAFSCGNSNKSVGGSPGSASAMDTHTHSQGSWSIANANNLPPGYALDIIYMDMTLWDTTVRTFPNGSVVMSNGVLTDSELTRFSSADGKFIYNNTPGSTKGTDTTHTHLVTGTIASRTPSVAGYAYYNNGGIDENANHSHSISITSSSASSLPQILTTRLYYTLQETSKALAGIVVFVDGSVGADWSILTGWANSNLVSGNSDPTLSGSDTHTQTITGNSKNYNASGRIVDTGFGEPSCVDNHAHYISATLTSTSVVPESKYVIPAVLLNTLYKKSSGAQVRIIGMMM